MPFLSSTHKNKITLARGKAFFQRRLPDGNYEGEFPLSPGAEFSFSVETEQISYESQEGGLGELLAEDDVSVIRSATLTCEQMSNAIRAMFLLADINKVAQPAGTITNEPASGVARPNQSYQLGHDLNDTGARNVSAVAARSKEGADASAWATGIPHNVGDFIVPTVANGHWYMATVAGTSGGAEPTFPTNGGTVDDNGITWQDMGLIDYTAGPDYEVDLDYGRINVLDIGAIANAIDLAASIGVNFSLEFDYTRAATSYDQVATSATTSLEGRFRFITENPKGTNGVYFGPDVRLSPNGDFAQKSGREYQSAGFTMGFRAPVGKSALYFNDAPVAA